MKKHTEQKYKQKPVQGTNKKIDRQISAKPVGWRRSDVTKKRYFENRENRSDTAKERKYHGRQTKKPAERKKTKTTSRTTTRGKQTAKRTAGIRKYDKQKPPKRGATDRTTAKKTQKTTVYPAGLRKNETLLAANSFETLMAFNTKNSSPFFVKKGVKNRVSLYESDIQLLKGAAIVTHNHPSGASFSGEDIATAIFLAVGEIRCFGKEYRYSLKPRNGKWFTQSRSVVESEYKTILDSLYVKYSQLFYERAKNMSDAAAQRITGIEHTHETITIYAKKKGLLYRREKF